MRGGEKVEKQTGISYLLLVLALAAGFLHNAVYGLFLVEEPIFFSLTLLLALVFIISIGYNTYTHIRKGKPKDLWRLGWLGIMGLVGFLPSFGPGFFGLYGFFAFFGLKGNKK